MAEAPLILLPAAGASSRMGGADKLLQPIDGEAILVRQARRAVATGAPVLVTLPPDRPGRAAALDGVAGVQTALVTNASEGLSASLKLGATEARRQGRDLLILLPDMPEIDTADLRAIVTARGDAPIARATAEDGTPGHPVLFAWDLLPEFDHLSGDFGAAKVIAAHKDRIRWVPLKGRRACRDLDTPADWAAYLSEKTLT